MSTPSLKAEFNQKWITQWNPAYGDQEVGIELLETVCWNCSAKIIIFLGLVFPVSPIRTWKKANRLYLSNLPLADLFPKKLEKTVIKHRSIIVERYGDSVAKLDWRSGQQKVPYFCSVCPSCGILQGDFPSKERRFNALRSTLEGTIEDPFLYYPIEVDIEINTLLALKEDQEFSSFSIYNFLTADKVHAKIDAVSHRFIREFPQKASSHLIEALKNGFLCAAEELLALGTSPKQVDENGDTPLSIAEKYCPEDGLSLLQQACKEEKENSAAKEFTEILNILKAWGEIDSLNPLKSPKKEKRKIFSNTTKWHGQIDPLRKDSVYIYTCFFVRDTYKAYYFRAY